MSNRFDLDNDIIKSLYLSGLSTVEIATDLNSCSSTIVKRLKKIGVKRRSHQDYAVKALATYRNKDWLHNQYVVLRKTQTEIGNLCGVDRVTVKEWLLKHGIPIISRKEYCLRNAKHFTKTAHSLQFIDGLLIGDGCISHESSVAASYSHSEKHKDYLEWQSVELDKIGIEQSGDINKNNFVSKGHYCKTFCYISQSYAELLDVRKRWYPHGVKIIPKDIVLSQILCRNWMIGDGHLAHSDDCRPFIVLCTDGFTQYDVMFLIGLLKDIGIDSTYRKSSNNIAIGVDHTAKFLNYIGPCPEEIWNCYGYKWDLTRNKKEWEAEFCQIAT